MNDLKQAVIAAMDKIVASGAIEKKIEETIQKTIESIINETFRDHSDFSKNLKEQLSDKIKINLDLIDLPTYNVMIENAIKTRVNEVMTEQHAKLIQENIDSILKIEEKDWKLSEFIEEFKEQLHEYDGERSGESITCIVENGGGGSYKDMWHIRIDEDEGKEKYHCSIKLFVSDDMIKSVKYDGEEWDKDKFIGWKRGIEATLFRIYSQGKKFIVDEDDVDTQFSDFD